MTKCTKIVKQFGTYRNFKTKFEEISRKRFGSGWCWLLYDKNQFRIATTMNQDTPLMDVVYEPGNIIIALDLWEHSYYLKYKNDRAKYIDAFFKLMCWSTSNERFTQDQY